MWKNRTKFFISAVIFFLLHVSLAGAWPPSSWNWNPFNRGGGSAKKASSSSTCAPSGGKEVKGGLFRNDKPDTSEFTVLPKVYDFDNGQCGNTTDNTSSCYGGLFSTNTPNNTKIFKMNGYAYYMPGFGNISPSNPDLQYKWKAASGKNYARLFVAGPGTSDLVLKTMAFGDTFRFKIYRTSAELQGLGLSPVSGNVSGKVEIWYRDESSTEMNILSSVYLTKDCGEVGTYKNETWDSSTQQYKLPQYFPPDVFAVMKACPYEPISIEIPDFVQGKEVQVVWTLSATSQFQNSWERCPKRNASCACPMKELCSTFNPAVAYSIDDIEFKPSPAVPDFRCESYDIDKGGDPQCKLNKPDKTAYFRVKRDPSSSGATPAIKISGLGGSVPATTTPDGLLQSDFAEPGTYTVDVIGEGGPLSNGKHAIYGVSKDKAMIRVSESSSKPIAARLTETAAIVFPPLTPPQCNPSDPQPVISYEIYRRNVLNGLVGDELIQVMNADEMVKSGFRDNRVIPDTQPSYLVKPVYGQNQKGPFSPRETISPWVPGSISVSFDHFMLPENPSHIKVSYQSTKEGIPLDKFRILRATPLSPDRPNALGFKVGSSPQYSPSIFLTKVSDPAGGGDFATAMMSLVEDNASALPKKTYDELPEVSSFWVVTGDLAKPSLSIPQLTAALSFFGPPKQLEGDFSACYRDPAVPATNPRAYSFMDLCDCSYSGKDFTCITPQANSGNALYLSIPTPHEVLGRTLRNMYFNSDPTSLEGLLKSPYWKNWAKFSDIKSVQGDFMQSDVPAVLAAGALEAATYDMAQLIAFDRTLGNNIFKTGSNLITDWVPAIDSLFVKKYFQPLANLMTDQSALPDTTLNNTLARLNSELEDSYFALFRSFNFSESLPNQTSPPADPDSTHIYFIIGTGSSHNTQKFPKVARYLESWLKTLNNPRLIVEQDVDPMTNERVLYLSGASIVNKINQLPKDQKKIFIFISRMGPGVFADADETSYSKAPGLYLTDDSGLYTELDIAMKGNPGGYPDVATFDKIDKDIFKGAGLFFLGSNSHKIAQYIMDNTQAQFSFGTRGIFDFYSIPKTGGPVDPLSFDKPYTLIAPASTIFERTEMGDYNVTKKNGPADTEKVIEAKFRQLM